MHRLLLAGWLAFAQAVLLPVRQSAHGHGRLGPVYATVLSEGSDTGPLYATVGALIKDADKSPRVRALSTRWTTLPPAELVENALIIGKVLVGSFEKGCELLAQAEEFAGLTLSGKAYGALMRIGQAEQRSREVLGLLGRVRARGVETTPTILSTAMAAAADTNDWGAVCRLFGELAGTDIPVEALELVGPPSIIADARKVAQLDAEAGDKLSRSDAAALRLVMRAHCRRGDAALAISALERLRALQCPLELTGYVDLVALAREGSNEPLLALRAQDVGCSLGSVAEAKVFAVRNAWSKLVRADRELLLLVLLAAGGVALASSLLAGLEPAATTDALDF